MRCAASAWPCTEGDGAITVTPPPLPLRPADRGRPDRGGRARGRLRQPADHAAAGADHRARAARSPAAAASPCAARWPRSATRKPSTSASSRRSWERELAGNADPIKLLNPIASQMGVMRSSLLGSLLQVLKFNLDRKARRACACSRSAACSCATTRSRPPTARCAASTSRCAWPAWPGATPTRLQWGGKAQRVDFFDVKGDVEALLAPRGRTFEAAEHPAMHPGRCAARAGRRPGRSASSANCIRAGARPTSCRRRRCCSSSTSMPCTQRAVPVVAAGAASTSRPSATSRWWWPKRSRTTR